MLFAKGLKTLTAAAALAVCVAGAAFAQDAGEDKVIAVVNGH